MEQKFESFKKENPQELSEHYDFVKDAVKDGSYFKDGLNWYFFRYVNPFCERTIFIFAAIVASVIFYCLIQMIQGTYPLVQKDPIIISATDQSQYFPNLIPLKPHIKGPGSEKYDPLITTVDEAIAKYLVSVYISNREGYDFSQSEIEEVNNKFHRIRNTSSAAEYREFQLYMSKDNLDSPILNFGHNVVKTVDVQSVRFLKEPPKTFAEKAKSLISVKIPTDVEVRFVTTLKTTDDNGEVTTAKQNYVAKINFAFSGAQRNVRKDGVVEVGSNQLSFLVNSYKLFKVQ